MTVGVRASGWARDPVGRFAQRYWDGTRWTEHVAGPSGGAPQTDRLPRDEPTTPPRVDAGVDGVTAARDGADRRGVSVPTTHPEGGAPTGAAPTGLASAAPAWALDPTGRYAQRYWDGTNWTAFVAPAGGGTPTRDLVPTDLRLGAPSGVEPGGSTPSEAHHRDAHDLNSPTPLHPAAAEWSAIAFGTPRPAEPIAAAPQWAPDPSGRAPQRYWDGRGWSGYVAGVDGGAPIPDAVLPGEEWAAPHGDPASLPAAATTSAAAGSASPVAGRRKLLVALGVLGVLGAAIAVLALTGVLGGGGSPAKSTANRVRGGAARSISGPRTGTGSAATPTTAAPTSGPVNPGTDPCGLLDAASIAKATGIAVASGRPIENGCAWQGPNSAGSGGDAQNRQLLNGHEGVVATVLPPGTQRPSVTCTASIVGVSVPGGICSLPGTGGHYAMFETHSYVIDLAIVSAHASTDDQLTQLAQVASSRSQ